LTGILVLDRTGRVGASMRGGARPRARAARTDGTIG
jgi:hypothetical protein